MPLKVIGTGVGRTGTLSLKYALEELGFGKCYHMMELINNYPEQVIYFEAAERGEKVDWEKMFGDEFQSAVDFPVAKYYEQLAAYYPDAKLIHTMREPESWYKSAFATILNVGGPPLPVLIKMMFRSLTNPLVRKQMRVFKYVGGMKKSMFGDDMANKQAVIGLYNKFNEEALAKLPKKNLLIYDVKTGWEPLCNFLGVPVPNKPFPKVNSTEEFQAMVKNR